MWHEKKRIEFVQITVQLTVPPMTEGQSYDPIKDILYGQINSPT
jgi:hypothetical protein